MEFLFVRFSRYEIDTFFEVSTYNINYQQYQNIQYMEISTKSVIFYILAFNVPNIN